MGRYDWPQTTLPQDDPRGRERYNARYLPGPDVRPADGTEPPAPAAGAPRARGRAATATPRAAPSGPQHLWLPLGPSTVVGGQATGRPRVVGRIRDLAVEPTAGERVYAASASGGVWFSPDRGLSWRPLDEFSVSPNRDTLFPIGNTLATGAVHVRWGEPADGSDDEVVVGTGEPGAGGGAGTPGGKVAGVGILRAVGPAVGNPWLPVEAAPGLRGESVWRITADPGTADTASRQQYFAATTDGLYARPPGGAWAKVASLTANTGVGPPHDEYVLDMAVTRLTGPDRIRIWVAGYGRLRVAELSGAPATTLPLNLAGLAFQVVPLTNVMPTTRVALAAGPGGNLWVLGRRPRTGTETNDPAHLWQVTAGAALASVAATEITGLPPRLFMSASDQSDYDMTIAAHPDHADVVYVAGAAVSIDNEWNAAFYRVAVAGTAATPTLVGKGVHADCHIIRIGPAPSGERPDRAVWMGCDGGLFLSDRDGTDATFVPRNTGLSVLQPGFVACHPTNDGLLAAGMQDNGTCDRVGDTVWREPFLGDGGGVVYDPTHDNRYLRQYTTANWQSSDHTGVPPVFRRRASAPAGQKTSEQVEDEASLFYSGAAALAHGGTTHLALGTDRVWYSPDWGATWVTLPTGTDPRSGRNADLAQDVLDPGAANGRYTDTVDTFLCCSRDYHGSIVTGTGILTCRLSARADDGANRRVRLLALWNGGLTIIDGTRPAASTGAWSWAFDVVEPIRPAGGAAEQAAVDSADPVAFLPALGKVNDVAVHDPARGAHGSCYVATIGADGSGAGHEIDTVWWYDGAGRFVPCGLRRAHPRSAWSGTRITAPALSVVVDPDDPDLVYVGTSVGVVKGSLTMVDNAGTPEPHWAWSAYDNGLPEGAVHDLTVYRHAGVKLLRAALQSRGVWEVDLAAPAAPRTFLRLYPSDTRRRRPTPLSGPPTAGEPGVRWDASPDIVFDPSGLTWPAVGPGEADLFELPVDRVVGEHAAQALSARTFKVHVLVHHRWHVPAAAADVRVAL
ncbi:MAG TPA: hypothetical protein VFO65_05525, partial [Acidimicrobiales bacterium]|nr:hypothetical protein [Acidimicrobiales bacterium]